MSNMVEIAGRQIGDDQPAFIVAEIGINHNGDLELAKRIIDAAVIAGCDAVKFQKRTPELSVPHSQRDVKRSTPWGDMTYFDYRHRLEFGKQEYEEIDVYCRARRMIWFASAWDEVAVDFLEEFTPPCYKVASASLTDDNLLKCVDATGRPIVLSTGMSTKDQIGHAVSLLDSERLIIAHCTSSYPCVADELNLRMIQTLRQEFGCVVGYSGHEVGLQTTYAAFMLGAHFIERHLTLDRGMWGSDHSASVEPDGFRRLVRDIRVIERALGDGVKRVYESELPLRSRLRRVEG